MFKLKILLLLTIIPLTYLIYHLIGFENGLNAYVHKMKILKSKKAQQEHLNKEIKNFKEKILFLDNNNVNIDFLEEKSYELGNSPNDSYTIMIK